MNRRDFLGVTALPLVSIAVPGVVSSATAEPDGSYRRYVLRVPPNTRNTREAIAWTFGFDNADDYILDFNKAYNPPCAYNPYATCPLPSARNRLPVEIPAGEKRYH